MPTAGSGMDRTRFTFCFQAVSSRRLAWSSTARTFHQLFNSSATSSAQSDGASTGWNLLNFCCVCWGASAAGLTSCSQHLIEHQDGADLVLEVRKVGGVDDVAGLHAREDGCALDSGEGVRKRCRRDPLKASGLGCSALVRAAVRAFICTRGSIDCWSIRPSRGCRRCF